MNLDVSLKVMGHVCTDWKTIEFKEDITAREAVEHVVNEFKKALIQDKANEQLYETLEKQLAYDNFNLCHDKKWISNDVKIDPSKHSHVLCAELEWIPDDDASASAQTESLKDAMRKENLYRNAPNRYRREHSINFKGLDVDKLEPPPSVKTVHHRAARNVIRGEYSHDVHGKFEHPLRELIDNSVDQLRKERKNSDSTKVALVQVHIIYNTSDEQAHVVVWDNGPGMDFVGVEKDLLFLGKNAIDRGHEPGVSVHGRGFEQSTSAISNQIYVRAHQTGKEAIELPICWQNTSEDELSRIARDVSRGCTLGNLNNSCLNNIEGLSQHKCISQCLDQETKNDSFFMVILQEIHHELMEELLMGGKTDEGIPCKMEVMCSRLAATYHFIMHGKDGKDCKQLHSSPEIQISISYWEDDQDEPKKIWNLHELSGDLDYTFDPIAKLINASPKEPFTIKFRPLNKPKTYEMEFRLYYVPHDVTQTKDHEEWQSLMQNHPAKESTDPARLFVYWMDRGFPLESFSPSAVLFNHKSIRKVIDPIEITPDQLKRVRGLLMIGEDFEVNHTKQNITGISPKSLIEKTLDVRYESSDAGRIEVECEIIEWPGERRTITFEKEKKIFKKDGKLKDLLKTYCKWITNCASDDKIGIMQDDGSFKLPIKVPTWTAKQNCDENLEWLNWPFNSHQLHLTFNQLSKKPNPNGTIVHLLHDNNQVAVYEVNVVTEEPKTVSIQRSGTILAHDVFRRDSGAKNSPKLRVSFVYISDSLTLKKGTRVAYLTTNDCLDFGTIKSINEPMKNETFSLNILRHVWESDAPICLTDKINPDAVLSVETPDNACKTDKYLSIVKPRICLLKKKEAQGFFDTYETFQNSLIEWVQKRKNNAEPFKFGGFKAKERFPHVNFGLLSPTEPRSGQLSGSFKKKLWYSKPDKYSERPIFKVEYYRDNQFQDTVHFSTNRSEGYSHDYLKYLECGEHRLKITAFYEVEEQYQPAPIDPLTIILSVPPPPPHRIQCIDEAICLDQMQKIILNLFDKDNNSVKDIDEVCTVRCPYENNIQMNVEHGNLQKDSQGRHFLELTIGYDVGNAPKMFPDSVKLNLEVSHHEIKYDLPFKLQIKTGPPAKFEILPPVAKNCQPQQLVNLSEHEISLGPIDKHGYNTDANNYPEEIDDQSYGTGQGTSTLSNQAYDPDPDPDSDSDSDSDCVDTESTVHQSRSKKRAKSQASSSSDRAIITKRPSPVGSNLRSKRVPEFIVTPFNDGSNDEEVNSSGNSGSQSNASKKRRRSARQQSPEPLPEEHSAKKKHKVVADAKRKQWRNDAYRLRKNIWKAEERIKQAKATIKEAEATIKQEGEYIAKWKAEIRKL